MPQAATAALPHPAGPRPAHPARAPAAAPAAYRGLPVPRSRPPAPGPLSSRRPASAESPRRYARTPSYSPAACARSIADAACPASGSPGGSGGGFGSGAGYTSTCEAGRHTVQTRKVPSGKRVSAVSVRHRMEAAPFRLERDLDRGAALRRDIAPRPLPAAVHRQSDAVARAAPRVVQHHAEHGGRACVARVGRHQVQRQAAQGARGTRTCRPPRCRPAGRSAGSPG